MPETKKSVFNILDTIDVSSYTEKKGQFTYLSWAWAVRELLRVDPSATWRIHEYNHAIQGMMQPYMKTDAGCFVQVTVTVNGVNRTQVHPVLDHRNQTIKEPNAFEINTSIQRCLAKAIALHGLGLYIYAGEDLPTPPLPLDDADKRKIANLLEKIGDSDLEDKVMVQILDETINKHNLNSSLAKLKRLSS
tara:strand:+ start:4453 stop:5025 length:573 start_codon:yes stop_codon:yes gene_type:complete